VNPIEQGLDRWELDDLLREVSEAGVWVSAHPDVIMRMATKRVLFDTRGMSWGTDTRLYLSAAELHKRLTSLDGAGPRVLKQQRGMGGQGVWKIERDPSHAKAIVAQEARGGVQLPLSVEAFVARCKPYFERGGMMVEQPFQERIIEGMIRVYLTHESVVGFAHQYPAGLRPESAGVPPPGKTFETAGGSTYSRLRASVELEWVPQMQRLLGIDTQKLPVIWDADFLFGAKTRRRHLPPLRDQREFNLRVSRARDADRCKNDTRSPQRTNLASGLSLSGCATLRGRSALRGCSWTPCPRSPSQCGSERRCCFDRDVLAVHDSS
jgi:uncharacterized protein DUF6815